MRPTQHQYFMDIAKAVASRSNCYRRKVGCVLVNSHNEILATGYNGVPRGVSHCSEETCPRSSKKSGEALDQCPAIHAEMNALIQCKNIWDIKKAYVTVSPCLMCTAALMNTACQEIYFIDFYPYSKTSPMYLWLNTDERKWVKLDENSQISETFVRCQNNLEDSQLAS